MRNAKYRNLEHQIAEYCSLVERRHTAAFDLRATPIPYMEALAKTWCPVDQNYFDKWTLHLVKIKNKVEETDVMVAKIETERKGVSLMTKPGYKSTEAWITLVLVIIGGLLSTGIIGDGTQVAQILGTVTTIASALGYTASRTAIKKGSNDA